MEEVSEMCFLKSLSFLLQAHELFLWRSNRCLTNTNSPAPGRNWVSSAKAQSPEALFLYITHELQWEVRAVGTYVLDFQQIQVVLPI